MDDKGFDPDHIDDALAAFKLLNSEMKVAVTSISAKSREIHELRDNKLLPELNKLIDGYGPLASSFYYLWSPITYVTFICCSQITLLLMNLLKNLRSLLHLYAPKHLHSFFLLQ